MASEILATRSSRGQVFFAMLEASMRTLTLVVGGFAYFAMRMAFARARIFGSSKAYLRLGLFADFKAAPSLSFLATIFLVIVD